MQNVIFLGLVSFFTDLGTEMIYPVVPLYLTSAFGATPALVGLIEGIAESLASLLRVYGGYISDKFQKKKAIAFAGYFTALFYKFILIFAGSWAGVLLARVVDRFGKGIRTAPRDVLVSESAESGRMGRAFGLHKALDLAGSALGILFTYFLFRSMAGNAGVYRTLFIMSIVPSILGLCMFAFIKERVTERTQTVRRFPSWRDFSELNGQLKLYLFIVLLFTLGNSSKAFILLKAKAVGFDDTSVILLYFIYNATASLLSFPSGGLSDKIGRKRLLVCGYFVFSAVYMGFAFASRMSSIYAIFVLFGVHTAMIAGVERAFVAEISPEHLKGTMLGLHSTVAGIALFPASVITGLLWNRFGSVVPFVFGALLSAAAAVILMLFMRRDQNLC